MIARRRWHVNPNLADGLAAEKAFFIDQVGKADIYIDRVCVIEIVESWVEENRKNRFGTEYSYFHGQLKFPRIAHKLRAMRAMLWGHESRKEDDDD